jgi:hypothetical protein
LAGDVEFEALGDIPPPLAPNGGRKWSLHDLIVSQARERCTAARVRWFRAKLGHSRRHGTLLALPGRNFFRPCRTAAENAETHGPDLMDLLQRLGLGNF